MALLCKSMLAVNWVTGLESLLNRVGNNRKFKLIVFTLDHATYACELAPMAGRWPCLKIGPP
ncbi:MAG: glucuronate isomerase [Paracoccaceae bacterium]|jgi:glucuronate isomerase